MPKNTQKKLFYVFIVFSMIVLCSVIFAAPILSQMIEKELDYRLRNVTVVKVSFDKIKINILPPKITINNVSVLGDESIGLKRFQTKKIEILPSLGPSFLGHINVKRVYIEDPFVELKPIEKKQKQEKETSLFSFPKPEDFIKLTVEQIDLGQTRIDLTGQAKKISIFLSENESSLSLGGSEDVFKLKAKAQLKIDEQSLNIDHLNLNLNRKNDQINVIALNVLSELISIEAKGKIFPKPEMKFNGVIDTHQVIQQLKDFDYLQIENEMFGKVIYEGNLNNAWDTPALDLALTAASLDLWERNVSAFDVHFKSQGQRIDRIDGKFNMGHGTAVFSGQNIDGGDQGQVNLNVKGLAVKDFIHAIDPSTLSPISGDIDISASGRMSTDLSKMKVETKVTASQLDMLLEPEVKRFAPLVFNDVELTAFLTQRKGDTLSIEEGKIVTQGLNGKFSLHILEDGGVAGKWLGEVNDFSGLFKRPYPVKGSGQFLGGVEARKKDFTANVELNINGFSYEGSEDSELSGNIVFKNTSTSFKNIVIKTKNSKLTANVETSPALHLDNYVKASFSNFDLSLISKIAGRAYPVTKALEGKGDGEVYINIQKTIDGRIKLNAHTLNYNDLSFKNAALEVLIENGAYIFKESAFEGGKAKLQISGKISDNAFEDLSIRASAIDVASLGLPTWVAEYFETLSGKLYLDGPLDNPNIKSDIQCFAKTDPFFPNIQYGCQGSVDGFLNNLNWVITAGEQDFQAQGKYYSNTHRLEAKASTKDFVLIPFYKIFPTKITSELEFNGDVTDLSSAQGAIHINKMISQRKAETIFNQAPFTVNIKQGIFYIPQVTFLDNHQTTLVLSGQISKNLMDINLDGPLDMQNLLILGIGIERSEGLGNINLKVFGKPDSLSYRGGLNIKDGFIKLETFPHPFEKINFKSELEQNILYVNQISTVLGGGDLQLSGDINLQAKFLDSIINLQGRGERMNIRFPEFLPVELSGDVFLRGPMSAPTLGGNFLVLNGQYEDKWDWQSRVLTFSSQKYIDRVYYDEDISMYFDMNFKTQGKSFRLKNNIAQGVLQGEVRLLGSNEKIGLLGSIEVTDGEVDFLDNEFELENGAITFNDKDSIDPKFDLRATTTVSQKKIILDITSEGDNIVAVLSSDPYLDETSIVTLLTIGVEADEFLNSESQGNRFSSSFLPGVLSSPIQSKLEKGLQEVNVIDSLQFVPYFSEENQSTGLRVLVGKEILPRFRILYSTDLLQANSERTLRLQKSFNRNLSIQGNITDNNSTLANDKQIDFGLDFEFRFDF